MRRTSLLAGTALLILAGPATAETLREALVKAYNTNPTLTAARADVRAIDENVPIARAAGRPALDLSGGYSEAVLQGPGTNSLNSPDRSAKASTQLSVPIFNGGASMPGGWGCAAPRRTCSPRWSARIWT